MKDKLKLEMMISTSSLDAVSCAADVAVADAFKEITSKQGAACISPS